MNSEKKILALYPEYDSVLGPYTRPDGRKHIVLNNSEASKGTKGKTKTISYPKALKEAELGRRLKPNETVDHDDRNFTNDDLSNLIVRDRSKHASLDAPRVEVERVPCPICGSIFTPTVSQRNKQRSGEIQPAGPFCSRRCTGIYGSQIRSGAQERPRTVINKTYYLVDKE